MPTLEHPTQQAPAAGGWHANGNTGDPPHQHQPPRQGVGAHHKARHQPKPEVLGHGGIPGGGAADFAGNSDGVPSGGAGVVGAMPWLQTHSFHAREGAYVSLKESLDNSQEVSGDQGDETSERFRDIRLVFGAVTGVPLAPSASHRLDLWYGMAWHANGTA